MTSEQILDYYFWFLVIFSFGSLAWLAIRHRKHINPKIASDAWRRGRKLELQPDAAARWSRDIKVVTRIVFSAWVLWVVLIFAAPSLATR
jgi:hypothetical protein